MWDTEIGKGLVIVLIAALHSTNHHETDYKVSTVEQVTSVEFSDSPSIAITLCSFLLYSLRNSVFQSQEHTSLGDKVATEF